MHYTGEITGSEVHGVGVALPPDGTRSEGEFDAEAMHDRIKITRPDGSSYTGNMANNGPSR